MATLVTITGTGTPLAQPGLAGPGVLIQHGSTALQFDVGRATVLRLSDLGFDLTSLTAAFITHHHSDHLVGLADLLMTRWLEDRDLAGQAPLPVIAADGPAAVIAAGMLDIWRDEIAMRRDHTGRRDWPWPAVETFSASPEPRQVFRRGVVTVAAIAVAHEPVVPAVAYRVETPDGAVVISGDTAVCPTLEEVSRNADIVVAEAFMTRATAGLLSNPEAISAYHADTRELGAMAARAEVGTLVLTHLIPPLGPRADKSMFENDIRSGGFGGDVIVAEDLEQVAV